MMRIPAWRAQLGKAAHPMFLETCEAYELAREAILRFGQRQEVAKAQEFLHLANCLEADALAFATRGHC